MKKYCVKCKTEHFVENFYKNLAASDKLSSYCKDCSRQESRKYVEKQKSKSEKVDAVSEKRCWKCNVVKQIDAFSKDRTKSSGRSTTCKSCSNQRSKEFREENENYAVDYNKSYYKANETRLKQAAKVYARNNREKLIIARRKYEKFKLQNDQIYKLTRYLRDNLRKGLKKGGLQKNCRTIEILGCTIEEFKLHLEEQFTEGMTWENYGEWHIDHKKPCAAFNLKCESEVKKCFHYTNHQPLWATENRLKNSFYENKKHYYENRNN